MSRLYQYQAGDILLEGRSLTDVPTHDIAGLGLGRTFQNLAMFRTHDRHRQRDGRRALRARSAGFVRARCGCRRWARRKRGLRERAHEIMDYLGLPPVAQPARRRPAVRRRRSASSWAARWPPTPSC